MNVEIEKEISKCIQVMRDGGYAIFPSEIGWSIGCDAAVVENSVAIINSEKYLYPAILLSESGRLSKFAKTIPDAIYDMIEFSTKPLHLVMDDVINLPYSSAKNETDVAFRIVKDEFSIMMTTKFGKPICAAILSTSGQPEKTTSALNKNCYVVNLRAGAKANADNLVVIRLLKNEKFEFIRK